MKRHLVYIVQVHPEHLKIGVCHNLYQRKQQMQCGNPYRVEVLGVIACGSDKERNILEYELHSLFRKYRVI